MKRFIALIAFAGMVAFSAAPATASAENMYGIGFVDLNGDGINDNALDADGDGVPNGQDADFVAPADGAGQHLGAGAGAGTGARSGAMDGAGSKGASAQGSAKRMGRR
ncbi:hypothetical protein [Chlorobium sp. N1]|uniref:hypothetical protein n=1 Tax=Chlorobium sp. N1 TaxID=2491138 RepID=UPI001039B820|nr:hypothetical protein [Chlorobium sp. N1]TCD47334.1 hypothetical protein E0L29_08590 [Chlorobium sp. N1]